VAFFILENNIEWNPLHVDRFGWMFERFYTIYNHMGSIIEWIHIQFDWFATIAK